MNWDIYLRSLAVLALVVGLIAAVAWLARRLGMGILVPRGNRRRRLSIEEILPLDNRRRLVVVRWDGSEHLLLVGGTSDIVVDRGVRTAFAADLARVEEKETNQ
ncbi:FliO/MopB family protein [Telmatospirillum siberiense]|nr:flagellar biosynthetic protein FliO [Telmatospirillum siberiense]